jgi:hypothetical protein
MRVGLHAPLAAVLIALAFGCGGERQGSVAIPVPRAEETESAGIDLEAEDIRLYLQVREVALERLDRELAAAERRGVGALAAIEELSVAERRAAELAGADWKRYTAVRDEIGHLLSLQRRREDARVLGLELRRAREDLTAQLTVARDAASRQFLQAQIDRLAEQIGTLEEEGEPTPSELRHAALLATVRVSIATQQGRLERIQRRAKELLQDARGTPEGKKPAPQPQVN